jgi:EAL domain-containing protein (putative c-di-GMP-specific phosphodiesterase class I)
MEAKYAEASGAKRVRPRLLVIDDDQLMRKLLARVLTAKGYDITLAHNGAQAKELLAAQGAFDLILTDVHMPQVDGIGVLKLVRETDSDFPVILFTASPSAETAIGALQLHATAYLTKPIDPSKLTDEIDKALKLHELARVRKEAHDVVRFAASADDARREITSRFDRAVASLYMLYQPIVCWSERRVFGYEALVRSGEASLPHPGALFDAAEQLMRWDDLCRNIRSRCAGPLQAAEPECLLFVNVHARELLDDTLYDRSSALAGAASRIVLEITERAHLETVPDVESRINRLRALGFRIAIDDIGAGYSGLNSFTMLHPDLIKLDMALVRDIDSDPVKRRLAGLLVQLCKDLGIGVVGEGVETGAEKDTLLELGCDLLQGFLFGHPAAPFLMPSWGDE